MIEHPLVGWLRPNRQPTYSECFYHTISISHLHVVVYPRKYRSNVPSVEETFAADVTCPLGLFLTRRQLGHSCSRFCNSWIRNLFVVEQYTEDLLFQVHVPAEVQKFGCGVDHMITICKSFT